MASRPPFLNADGAGNGEGDAAHRGAQALQDQGIAPAYRLAQEPEDQPNLDGMGEPRGQPPSGAADEVAGAAVEVEHRPVEAFDAVGQVVHPRTEGQGADHRRQFGEPLQPLEREDHDDDAAEGGKGRSQPDRVAVAGRRREQQRRTDHREQELGAEADRKIGDHRGRGLDARRPTLRQQAGTDDLAADLGGRQQLIDRLADPPEQEDRPGAGTDIAGDQAAPAQGVEMDVGEAVDDDDGDPPADTDHPGDDLAEPEGAQQPYQDPDPDGQERGAQKGLHRRSHLLPPR